VYSDASRGVMAAETLTDECEGVAGDGAAVITTADERLRRRRVSGLRRLVPQHSSLCAWV
jgi:hypothetical protein